MPSLKEYILTLQKYNPGITDKSITIYLLKDGWDIHEIEKTFTEINGGKTSGTPANTASGTSIEIQSGELQAPHTAAEPKSQSNVGSSATASINDGANANTDASTNISASTTNQSGGAINHPTFDEVKNRVESSGVVTAYGIPKAGLEEALQEFTREHPDTATSRQNSNSNMVSGGIVGQPTKSNFFLTKDEILNKENANAFDIGNTNTKSANQIDQLSSLQKASTEVSSRPKFSYEEIMEGKDSPVGNVNDADVYSPLKATEPAVLAPKAPEFQSAPVSVMNANPTASASDPLSTPVSPSVSTLSQPKTGNLAIDNIPDAATIMSAIPVSNAAGTAVDVSGGLQNQPVAQAQALAGVIPTASSAAMVGIQTGSKNKLIKRFVLIVLGILFLFAAGFGYFKYVHGVYLFVHEPYDKEHFIRDLVKNSAKIETAEYVTSFNIKASNKEDSVDIFELPTSEFATTSASTSKGSNDQIPARGMDSIFGAIPNDAGISGGMSGLYDRTNKSQNGKFAINGEYNGDGLNIAVDAESLKIDDSIYVRLNKFPSFFIDLSSVKDKWIRITKDDLPESFASFWYKDTKSAVDKGGVNGDTAGSMSAFNKKTTPEEAKKQITEIIEMADANKVLQVVGEPVAKTIEDKSRVYEYKVAIDLPRLINFVEQTSKKLQAEYGEKSIFNVSEKALAELKSEDFAKYINYTNKNSDMLIGVDTKGFPRYISISSKMAFKSKGDTKQINSIFKLSLNNINKKITLAAPAESIPYIDAYSKVTGKSKAQILFDKQALQVETIRGAIQRYVDFTGEVPTLLQDLTKSTAELKPQLTNSQGTSTRPIYEGGLSDVFTGSNYVYQKTEKNTYTLTYSIKLPEVPADGYSLLYAVGAADYGAPFVKNKNPKPTFMLRFVNGENTATESILSNQANILNKNDKDKDKVTDLFEQYLGTDPAKTDTDGDGTSDYDEIKNNTNPKGDGDWAQGYAINATAK